MFCDVLRLIYFLKLPCRTRSVIAYSAGALLYQKIFMVAEQWLLENQLAMRDTEVIFYSNVSL